MVEEGESWEQREDVTSALQLPLFSLHSHSRQGTAREKVWSSSLSPDHDENHHFASIINILSFAMQMKHTSKDWLAFDRRSLRRHHRPRC